ncbi:MAG: hypothetical protein MK111_23655 [Crocosphaera sp.]|uniref:hypothetical protein n=1 Tax=Crocosphaera sp. TaxID=2729996 RepID=UPI002587C14C|nr:hypothetical protein [Crocosphaera sp.]MCH2232579.1 hypothetical protein [Crocinitomicaceae bacterium]MCH2247589.1 hypothetical protein [Crocosphaera sp.]
MTTYTITIKIPKAGNKEIKHNLNLLDSQEDFPEDFFGQEKNVIPIKQLIESQTLRTITPPLLKKLTATLIKEIKLGRRQITVSLNMPSEGTNSSTNTNTSFIDNTPVTPSSSFSPVSPTPKQPLPKIPKPRFPQPTQQKYPNPWGDNKNQPQPLESDDSEPTIILKSNQPKSQTSPPPTNEINPQPPSTNSPKPQSSLNSPEETNTQEAEEITVSYETANLEPDF